MASQTKAVKVDHRKLNVLYLLPSCQKFDCSWIWTATFWWRKRHLWPLCHNRWPCIDDVITRWLQNSQNYDLMILVGRRTFTRLAATVVYLTLIWSEDVQLNIVYSCHVVGLSIPHPRGWRLGVVQFLHQFLCQWIISLEHSHASFVELASYTKDSLSLPLARNIFHLVEHNVVVVDGKSFKKV